ncbi:hypothetical protein J2Z69_000912 [Paenibacillus shirakamiensis]|uniref:Uncharacterized protein n=1 Tax=Paenibacillus shirakamiensis TaxID=1265935 RepID=A0ABS4JDU2_9BACL|nr:hypothetical protein [Paenibacillus shirakamiensis]MBP1999893.1 hypothetical protein [Paenibacillus shirakamiensis]
MQSPISPNLDSIQSLTQSEVIQMILTSLVREEIALSQILKGEGEIIHRFLEEPNVELQQVLQLNTSLEKIIRGVACSQVLSQLRLQDILQFEPSDLEWSEDDDE